ncbi:phosphopantetheine-binding protein [Crossiella sp. SN42]|uniref:phosphopantetheine-binding protein n=1 Tax=Crossiella sp. SN42 TaxID=2944808 RepID=UPI00207C3F2E|nr:phosphopantetheine-binding protein [Crossiella sp. SN42]MCO1579135.1 phosphopantetheine-binding protein [Crossiella sp. SN42]
MHDSGSSVDAAGGMDVRDSIREFVRANITALGDTELSDDDHIFDKGFVTSIFAMQLLAHIEGAFGVEVPDNYLNLRNFSSVERMARMVDELRAARRG